MQLARTRRSTPYAPDRDKPRTETIWLVCLAATFSLAALLIAPGAYFMSHAGAIEKTWVISTLVAVTVTHIVRTFGR
jgi:hypothetical protein